MFIIERNQNGPRLWFFGKRIHHGFTGSVLLAIGAILCAHDRRDIRQWFKF